MSSFREFLLVRDLDLRLETLLLWAYKVVDTLYVIFDYINKHHLLQPPAKFWLKQQIWQVTNHHLEVFLTWWLVDKIAKVPDYFEDLPVTLTCRQERSLPGLTASKNISFAMIWRKLK